jgi:hypothetical protein
MIKNLLFSASALFILLTSASAQIENVPVKRNLNIKNGVKEGINAKTLVERKNNNKLSKKSANLSDGSLYYFSNARKINGGTDFYDYTTFSDNGTNHFAAYQTIPNNAEITLDSLEFFAESLGEGTTANLKITIIEGDNSYVDSVVINDSWTWQKIIFQNTIQLTDTFIIYIEPIDNLADSFDLGFTGGYIGELPFDSEGLVIEINNEGDTISGLQILGGDYIIEPYISYTLEDVTSSVNCLSNDNEEVIFTSPNASIIENPIWNYNAYIQTRYIIENNDYFYTAINIQEESLIDTTATVNYSYTFPTAGFNTVIYTERVAQWIVTDVFDISTTINLDLCTSVNEVQNDDLASIYPNPAKNILNVNLENNNATFTVFDLTGKIVRTEQLINKTNAIDVTDLTNGFYVYNLKTLEGEFTTGNFVVNK